MPTDFKTLWFGCFAVWRQALFNERARVTGDCLKVIGV
jgi:hypothetical protein